MSDIQLLSTTMAPATACALMGVKLQEWPLDTSEFQECSALGSEGVVERHKVYWIMLNDEKVFVNYKGVPLKNIQPDQRPLMARISKERLKLETVVRYQKGQGKRYFGKILALEVGDQLVPCNWKGTPLDSIQPKARPKFYAFKTESEVTRSELAYFGEKQNQPKFRQWLRESTEHEKAKFISIHKRSPRRFHDQLSKFRSTPGDMKRLAPLIGVILELQSESISDKIKSVKKLFDVSDSLHKLIEMGQSWLKKFNNLLDSDIAHTIYAIYKFVVNIAGVIVPFFFIPANKRLQYAMVTLAYRSLDVGVESMALLRNNWFDENPQEAKKEAVKSEKEDETKMESQAGDNGGLLGGVFSNLIAETGKFFGNCTGFNLMTNNEIRMYQSKLQSLNILRQIVPNLVDFITRNVNRFWIKIVKGELTWDEKFAEFEKEMLSLETVKPERLTVLSANFIELNKDAPDEKKRSLEKYQNPLQKKAEEFNQKFAKVPPKINPVTILVSGTAGTGKSTMLKPLGLCAYKSLGEEFEWNEHVFEKPETSAYWDGYNPDKHKVMLVDDFAVIKDINLVSNTLNDFMRMSTDVPCPLDFAHCAAKGKNFFSSEIVYVTSNISLSKANILDKFLADDQALKRRFDFVVEIEGRESNNYVLSWESGQPMWDFKKKKFQRNKPKQYGDVVDLAFDISDMLKQRRADMKAQTMPETTYGDLLSKVDKKRKELGLQTEEVKESASGDTIGEAPKKWSDKVLVALKKKEEKPSEPIVVEQPSFSKYLQPVEEDPVQVVQSDDDWSVPRRCRHPDVVKHYTIPPLDYVPLDLGPHTWLNRWFHEDEEGYEILKTRQKEIRQWEVDVPEVKYRMEEIRLFGDYVKDKKWGYHEETWIKLAASPEEKKSVAFSRGDLISGSFAGMNRKEMLAELRIGTKLMSMVQSVSTSNQQNDNIAAAVDISVDARAAEAISALTDSTDKLLSQSCTSESAADIISKIRSSSFAGFLHYPVVAAAVAILVVCCYQLGKWLIKKAKKKFVSYNLSDKGSEAGEKVTDSYFVDSYPGAVANVCESNKAHSHECSCGEYFTHKRIEGTRCVKCQINDLSNVVKAESASVTDKATRNVVAQSVSVGEKSSRNVVAQTASIFEEEKTKLDKLVDRSVKDNYTAGNLEKSIKGLEDQSTLKTFLMQYSTDPNAISAHRSTAANCVVISTSFGGSCRGLVVKGRLCVTVNHLIPKEAGKIGLVVNAKNVRDIKFTLEPHQIYRVPDQDVAFFMLPPSVPMFKDITGQLCTKIESTYERGFMSTVSFGKEMYVLLRSMDKLQPMFTREEWSTEAGMVKTKVVVSKAWVAQGISEQGDCGSVIYACSRNTPRKILGIHVARSHADDRTRICLVTPSDVENAIEFFQPKSESESTGETKVFKPGDIVRKGAGIAAHWAYVLESDPDSPNILVTHVWGDTKKGSLWVNVNVGYVEKKGYWFVGNESEAEGQTLADAKIRIAQYWDFEKGTGTGKMWKWSTTSTCREYVYWVATGTEVSLMDTVFAGLVAMPVIGGLVGSLHGLVSQMEEEVGLHFDEAVECFPESPFRTFVETGAQDRIIVGGDNAIIPSALHGVLPVTSYPSIMRPKIVNGVRIDPLIEDMKKGDIVKPCICEPEAVDEAIASFLECFRKSTIASEAAKLYVPRILNNHETVNGILGTNGLQSSWLLPINMHTAPGFPFKSGTGKFPYFERKVDGWYMRDDIEQEFTVSEMKLLSGERLEDFVFVPTLKAELRKKEKVDACQTRVFIVSNFVHGLLIRKYFGMFLGALMAAHNRFEVSVGINVHGIEATQFAERMDLEGVKFFVAGDYKSWDKTLHYECGMWFVRAANLWYNDHLQHVRQLLGESIFNGEYLIQGIVYNINGMMPSGVPITAVGNSVINLLLIRVGMYVAARNNNVSFKNVSESILRGDTALAAYGDDHLVSLDTELATFFNMRVYSEWLSLYNITYTTAEKSGILPEFVPRSEVTYLKRHILRQEDGRYKMPLPKTVLFDIINWQKKNLTQSEAIFANYDAFCIEMLHYGPTEFEWFTGLLVAEADKRGFFLPLYDYTWFSQKILRSVTTLGYTTMEQQLQSLIRSHMQKESHHVYAITRRAMHFTMFRWCPMWVSQNAKGGTFVEHHVCRRCYREALHLDSEEPRLCLACIGFGNLPDGYFHDREECDKCIAAGRNTLAWLVHEKFPFVYEPEARSKLEEMFLVNSMTTYNFLKHHTWNGRTTRDEAESQFLLRGHFCNIYEGDIPEWARNRVEPFVSAGLGRNLVLFPHGKLYINPPFLRDVYQAVFDELRRFKKYDVVIVNPVLESGPAFIRHYEKSIHGEVVKHEIKFVDIEWRGKKYGDGQTLISFVQIVKG